MHCLRLVLLALSLALGIVSDAAAQSPAPGADEYSSRIQPIFDGRCVACHSCNNAPCQLNLQSWSGFARGANTLNIYDRFRRHSVEPSRLDIDGKTVADWRAKGFFDVNTGTEPARNLLLRTLQQRVQHASLQPRKPVNESKVCVADIDQQTASEKASPELGMPYGLPPLKPTELATLTAWIANGAPGPTAATLDVRTQMSSSVRAQAAAWEELLNDKAPRRQLISRYLYEHLFLAHHYFPQSQDIFYRLVRSRTPCSAGIDEIATRRPNDDPGGPFAYCLKRLDGAVVDKTHMPYELTAQKLERIRSTFLTGDWSVSKPPAYSTEEAKNPFATFAEIPVRARYQFLLDDAHYEISTFIKGPVCNGSTAVNSIQEQFFVFFLKPDADAMTVSAENAAEAKDMLVLPGAWGSDVPLASGIGFLRDLVAHREQYRRLRAAHVKAVRPAGYALDDIWDGDGRNPNAVLTVLRHFDNAAVFQGAVGDLSKTVFVLDYPLLERMVYNLVVNFDVSGNVGHQSLTRLYMDMIRMEAEELFLTFLPPGQRSRLRQDWYRGGLLTDAKTKLLFPLLDTNQPTAVRYRNEREAKTELVQRILFERMPAAVRGRVDALNWKTLQIPADERHRAQLSPTDAALRRMTSVRAANATPFARFMPDLANVLVRTVALAPAPERQDKSSSAAAPERQSKKVYSIVHNREHDNVSWIAGESRRLAPEDDTLTVREGFLGAYPNMFFVVDEAQAGAFAEAVTRLRSKADYARVVARFGVPRSDDRFWSVYDEINAHFRATEPVEFGWLDLTRYELID